MVTSCGFQNAFHKAYIIDKQKIGLMSQDYEGVEITNSK